MDSLSIVDKKFIKMWTKPFLNEQSRLQKKRGPEVALLLVEEFLAVHKAKYNDEAAHYGNLFYDSPIFLNVHNSPPLLFFRLQSESCRRHGHSLPT